MWVFYALSLLLFAVGGVLCVNFRQITVWEWLVAGSSAFLVAVIFQICLAHGMTADTETWSGQVTEARHYSQWTEYYEAAIYRTEYYTVTVADYSTDSKGRSRRSGSHQETRSREVFDHWEPRTATHEQSWDCGDTLGHSYNIDNATYLDIISRFGTEGSRPGSRTTMSHNSRMIAGDPNDYCSINKNGYVKPTHDTRSFTNRVKASPSTFSFREVPATKKVFDYPVVRSPFASERLKGAAVSMGQIAWDQMNSRLGPVKKVNVIAVGFTDVDSSIANWQKSKWLGGKKNDIVICYGVEPGAHRADWVQVFGWTESELCKRNLETIFLDNDLNTTIIPLVEAEISTNYVKKDWKKFDYLSIEPPSWSFFVFFGVIVLMEGVIYAFFWANGIDRASILVRRDKSSESADLDSDGDGSKVA